MSKEFKKLSQQKRIESPIAKYNQLGQLTCIVCNQIVKSELMWNAHINSKSHLEAKNQLKMKLIGEQAKPISNNIIDDTSNKLKEKSTASQDNKMSSTSSSSGLKRTNNESQQTTTTTTQNKKQKIEQLIKKTDSIDLNNQTEAVLLPQATSAAAATSIEKKTNEIVPALPEGFFDDPDLDAKIRGQSREANLEAEYEEFKKIIQTEEFKSDIIVEQDDKLRDYDRDIQEVDVLIERWNKIESLHQRREAIKQQQKLKKNNPDNMDIEEKQDDEDDDDEEIDIKDVMNMALRSKNMF